MDFIPEGSAVDAGSAATSSSGIASLNHEVGDNSMEFYSVVVSSPGKFGEISTCRRCVTPVQLDDYFPHSADRKE